MCTSGGGFGSTLAGQVLKASPVGKIIQKNDPLKSDSVKSVTKKLPVVNTLLKSSPLLNAVRDESLG